MVPPATPLPLPVHVSTYPAAALNRGWFLTAAAAQALLPGQAPLALAFQLAPRHYPLSQATSFASAKAQFDKARMAKSGVVTPSNKPTIGATGTSAMAGTTAKGTSNAVGVWSGPFYQQSKVTRLVGQPFASNIILTPGVHFPYVEHPVSQRHSTPHPSISPTLVHYSSPTISSLSMQLPQWPTFLRQHATFLLGQAPALDLSRIPQFPQLQAQLPSWNIAGEKTGVGLPGGACNPGTLVSDMSGMEVTMGGNANALPTVDQFAQSLMSFVDEQKIVSFYAQIVTVHNAECMERMAKETLMKSTQITSALSIPTPAGNAIVSLTTTQTRLLLPRRLVRCRWAKS